MDGKGRALDNIFTERLWRTIKYEEVYLKDYISPREAREGLRDYLRFYNEQRLHQALDYRTPAEVYLAQQGVRYVGTSRPRMHRAREIMQHISETAMVLKDGRTLGYAEYGDPKGTPIMLFHG